MSRRCGEIQKTKLVAKNDVVAFQDNLKTQSVSPLHVNAGGIEVRQSSGDGDLLAVAAEHRLRLGRARRDFSGLVGGCGGGQFGRQSCCSCRVRWRVGN